MGAVPGEPWPCLEKTRVHGGCLSSVLSCAVCTWMIPLPLWASRPLYQEGGTGGSDWVGGALKAWTMTSFGVFPSGQWSLPAQHP